MPSLCNVLVTFIRRRDQIINNLWQLFVKETRTHIMFELQLNYATFAATFNLNALQRGNEIQSYFKKLKFLITKSASQSLDYAHQTNVVGRSYN